MKKLIYVLLLGVFLTSCVGMDKKGCLTSVHQAFPNSKIYIPKNGSNYEFIVIRTNGSVLRVTTSDMLDTDVTSVTPLYLVTNKDKSDVKSW